MNQADHELITLARLDKKLVHVCLFINKPNLSLSFELV